MELAAAFPPTAGFTFTPTPAVVAESALAAHRPPPFVHLPDTVAPLIARLPPKIRRGLRRVAVRVPGLT